MAYLMNLRESVFVRHSTLPRSLVAISVHTLVHAIHKMAKCKQKVSKAPSTFFTSLNPLSESAVPDTSCLTKNSSFLSFPLPETSVESL